jgi:hypothetical protein
MLNFYLFLLLQMIDIRIILQSWFWLQFYLLIIFNLFFSPKIELFFSYFNDISFFLRFWRSRLAKIKGLWFSKLPIFYFIIFHRLNMSLMNFGEVRNWSLLLMCSLFCVFVWQLALPFLIVLFVIVQILHTFRIFWWM